MMLELILFIILLSPGVSVARCGSRPNSCSVETHYGLLTLTADCFIVKPEQ